MCSLYRCKNLLTNGPGPHNNFIPGAGPIFFICFWYAHARFYFYAICSLEKRICLTAVKGTVSPSIFRLRSAPPQERQEKTYKTVFFILICSLPQVFFVTEIYVLPLSPIVGVHGYISICRILYTVNFIKP
jgi:hypothetical protein